MGGPGIFSLQRCARHGHWVCWNVDREKERFDVRNTHTHTHASMHAHRFSCFLVFVIFVFLLFWFLLFTISVLYVLIAFPPPLLLSSSSLLLRVFPSTRKWEKTGTAPPGTIVLRSKQAKWSAWQGCHTLDFDRGDERYSTPKSRKAPDNASSKR